MKTISKLTVLGLVILALVLGGCDKRKGVERGDVSFEALNSEEIKGEDTKELQNLLGHMTYGDLLNLLDDSMQKLNTLAKNGETTRTDYQTLHALIENVYHAMLSEQKEYEQTGQAEESSQALGDLITAAADSEVGVILNQLIKNTGPDILMENVYPMLVYALGADDDILKNATSGLTVGSFEAADEPEFYKALTVVNKLIDEDNPRYADYDAVREDLKVLVNNLKKNTDLDLKVEDLKDTLDDLLVKEADTEEESTSLDSEVLEAAIEAFSELWDNDPAFRAQIRVILAEAGALMTAPVAKESTNVWDADNLTDLARILNNLEEVMGAPGSTRRAKLKDFVAAVLKGMSATSDGATLEGMVRAISRVDIDNNDLYDIREPGIGFATKFDQSTNLVDKGLIQAVRYSMYAHDRTSTDEQTSELRSLIFLMERGNVDYDTLDMVSSPDNGGTVSAQTINIDAWTIGEIVTALQWAKSYSSDHTKCSWMKDADCNGDNLINDFEAYHWLLYKKDYKLLGLVGVDGLVGMMTNTIAFPLMWRFRAGVPEAFPALVELSGAGAPGMSEGTYGDASWKSATVYAYPAARHQIFALFSPLMQYFWEKGGPQGSLDMTALLLGMDEIKGEKPDYVPIYNSINIFGIETPTDPTNPNATLRLDNQGEILKAVEGPQGYGTLYYALRSHEKGAIDGKLLDALLAVLMRVVDKLDSNTVKQLNPDADGPYANQYVFPALMAELDIQATTDADIAETVEDLFGADGKSGTIQDIYDFLTRNNHANRTAVIELAQPAGQLMTDLSASLEMVGQDVKAVWPVVDVLLSSKKDATNTMDELLDYLRAGDNPFNRNARILAYRALDIQDATYNPAGTIGDEIRIAGPDGLLVKLLGGPVDGPVATIRSLITGSDPVFIGADPLYDFNTLTAFLKTVTKPGGIYQQHLWSLVYSEDDGPSLLDKIMGDVASDDQGLTYTDIDMRVDFLRAMFKPVGGQPSVVYSVLEILHLGAVDYNGLLYDLADLMGGEGLKPGTEDFDKLLKTLEFAATNLHVQ